MIVSGQYRAEYKANGSFCMYLDWSVSDDNHLRVL